MSAPEKVRLNGRINLFFHCGALAISGISGNNPLHGSRSAHFGHDHGLVRLHIHELVVDVRASVQAKILTIFLV